MTSRIHSLPSNPRISGTSAGMERGLSFWMSWRKCSSCEGETEVVELDVNRPAPYPPFPLVRFVTRTALPFSLTSSLKSRGSENVGR